MKIHSDREVMDFLDTHEVNIRNNEYFSVITQHVSRNTCKTIKEFCSYAIELEKMLESNSISSRDWHGFPSEIQHVILEIWERHDRALNGAERQAIREELEERNLNSNFLLK